MGIEVNGSVALVTGANRGIGKSIVQGLLAGGASKVYAAVRDVASAQPLVDEHGDKVVPVAIDLSDEGSVNAAAQAAGDVTVVVNNAGVLTTNTALGEGTYEGLAFEHDVNVLGLLRVARAFAPVLKGNGGGAFVQLNSVVSVKSFAQFATYSASKAAAYSLTQALRDDLGEQGTQVHSVHPGPIATDMGRDAGLEEIAEPASVVSDAIIAALASGAFHVFPDSMAQQIGGAYASFAENIVEADLMEA